jgi:glycosyltransferase involved in cell wall biosynthesis
VHSVKSRAGAILRLHSLLAEGRFQVVHAHDAHAVTAAWCAGAHRRAAFFASRRVAYPLARGRIAQLRYRCATSIIAVSRFVKDSVLAAGFPDGQVQVVYDGVSVPEPAPRGNGTTLGCVGYLLPEKGQEVLLRALPLVLVRYPACRLVLAGDGPLRAHLQRLAASLGISGAVEFAGHTGDVASVYRALDIFVFPSLAEPLGSSLLAAMSYGLPAVAASGGAVPEVIEDGENGLLVKGREPAAFAEAILRLLDSRALAGRLGAAARQTIAQRFTAAHLAAGTLRLYRRGLM